MASSLVNNKYRITKRIGGGSFGEIYMGVGPNNNKKFSKKPNFKQKQNQNQKQKFKKQ
jgi:hypothetical protein